MNKILALIPRPTVAYMPKSDLISWAYRNFVCCRSEKSAFRRFHSEHYLLVNYFLFGWLYSLLLIWMNMSVGASGIYAADMWMLNATSSDFSLNPHTRDTKLGLLAVAGSKLWKYLLMLNDRPHIVQQITSHRRTECYFCINYVTHAVNTEQLDSNEWRCLWWTANRSFHFFHSGNRD